MNRSQLNKLAEAKGWTVEILGSFADGYEAEIEAPSGHVIVGTDSDYQYIAHPESCAVAELVEEVRYIIEDIGSEPKEA